MGGPLVASNGQTIDQNHDLSTVIEMHQPGQTPTFTVELAARPKNS